MSEGSPKAVTKERPAEDELSAAEAMDGRYEANGTATEASAEKFAAPESEPAPEAEIASVKGRLEQQKPAAAETGAEARESNTENKTESAIYEAKDLLDNIATRDREGLERDFQRAQTPEQIMEVVDDALYKEDRMLADRKRGVTTGTLVGGGAIMAAGIFLGSAAVASTGIGIGLVAAPAAYLYLRRRYAKRHDKHMAASISIRKKLGLSPQVSLKSIRGV